MSARNARSRGASSGASSRRRTSGRSEPHAAEALVQVLGRPREEAVVRGRLQAKDPLRHATGRRDDDDHDARRLQRQHLDVPDGRGLERRGGDEREQPRRVREHLGRRPQRVLDLVAHVRGGRPRDRRADLPASPPAPRRRGGIRSRSEFDPPTCADASGARALRAPQARCARSTTTPRDRSARRARASRPAAPSRRTPRRLAGESRVCGRKAAWFRMVAAAPTGHRFASPGPMKTSAGGTIMRAGKDEGKGDRAADLGRSRHPVFRGDVHAAPRRESDERGASSFSFALVLPLILTLSVIVVDVGNWYVHSEAPADAGRRRRVCGGDEVRRLLLPVRRSGGANVAIRATALDVLRATPTRDPATKNLQVQEPDDVHVVLNSAAVLGKRRSRCTAARHSTTRSTSTANPATRAATRAARRSLDVKATDDARAASLRVPAVRRRSRSAARVEIRQVKEQNGMLPWAVPEVEPGGGCRDLRGREQRRQVIGRQLLEKERRSSTFPSRSGSDLDRSTPTSGSSSRSTSRREHGRRDPRLEDRRHSVPTYRGLGL